MTIKVTCPQCGAKIKVKGTGGRKPKNLTVKLVSDTLKACGSVGKAATELDCSRGHIYAVLKGVGLIPREVLDGAGR